MNLLFVAIGGALGSVLRYLSVAAIGRMVGQAAWGTFAVNVLGSFLIGLAFVLLAGRDARAAFVMTGLLGGFTTFSAFSLDALRLFEAGRGGEAAIYVAASVLLSLIAVFCGVMAGRMMT